MYEYRPNVVQEFDKCLSETPLRYFILIDLLDILWGLVYCLGCFHREDGREEAEAAGGGRSGRVEGWMQILLLYMSRFYLVVPHFRVYAHM